jgi:hypothetical protein
LTRAAARLILLEIWNIASFYVGRADIRGISDKTRDLLRALIGDLARALDRDRATDRALDLYLDRAFARDLDFDRIFVRDIELDLDGALDRALGRALAHANAPPLEIHEYFEPLLAWYFLLEDRAAGKEDALEALWLAKARTESANFARK